MKTRILKNIASVLLVFALASASVSAQTVEEMRKSIQSENYAQTIKMADGLITSNAKKPEPYFYKGFAFYKMAMEEGIDAGQKQRYLASANEMFSAGHSRNKSYPFNLVGMGLIDLQNNNFEGGKAKFKEADETAPTDVMVFVEMANGFIDYANAPKTPKAKKDAAFEEAQTYLYKAEGKDKTNPYVYIALGDCYNAQGVDESALTNYEKAVKLNPNNAQAHFAVGRLLEKQKKYNEAVAAMKKAIEIDPKFAPAYKRSVEIYFRAGMYPNAKEMAIKYKGLIGADKQARVRYAQLMYFTNNYEEAVKEYAGLVKDTTSYDIYRLYGYSLCETKKYAESIGQLEQLFKTVKESDLIFKDYKYYGIALAMTGQVEKAEQYIEKAIATDPELVEIYKDLYNQFKAKEDWANAAKYIDKYLQKKDSPNDAFYYGWMLIYKLNEPKKAIDVLGKLVASNPQIVEAHDYMATAANKLDPKAEQGMAKPYYEAMIDQINKLDMNTLEEKKKDSYKKKLIVGCSYLASYYYTVSKDQPLSYAYALRVLELDPAHAQCKQIADYMKGQKVTPAELKK